MTARTPFSPLRTILFGGLAVGVTDILWAMGMNAMNGKGPVWVLQSVAGGLLGASTFQGGAKTALLGMVLHFTIATCWMTAYFLVSRKVKVLAQQPWIYGPLYGILAYVVMYQVVLPMSAYHTGGIALGWNLVKGLFIHIFGVGLLIALITRRGTAQPS
jgi:hypothetical protein